MNSHRRGMLELPGQELLVVVGGRGSLGSGSLMWSPVGRSKSPLQVPVCGGDLSFFFCCSFLHSLLLSFAFLCSPFLDGPLNGGEL